MAFPQTAISNFTHRPTAAAIRAQTGLRSLCYMWLKCHSLLGNPSACATEDSSGAGRGLFPFSPSETSASRETPRVMMLQKLNFYEIMGLLRYSARR